MGKNSMFNNARHIHFIGIGGIGVSALAGLFLCEGKKVSGTNDEESPETLDVLRSKGVDIHIGTESTEHISDDVDMFVYSSAWETRAPDFLRKIRERGVPVLHYFEALGLLSKEKFTIAVSGTHGKTTTTAMLAKILVDAGQSPSVVVGSFMKEFGSNYLSGSSDIFVVEACEYQRHFLKLFPDILVITNIDDDHLDYYKDIADIENAFRELAERVPKEGFIVCNPHNESVASVVKSARAGIIDYTKADMSEVSLRVPGGYNKQNAQAALAAARALGIARNLDISERAARAALEDFSGTWRRFEYKGKTENGALVYDDYAHHPTEIKAMLKAAREKFPNEKIIAVFQPHLYSRTKLLMNEFAESFADADEVVLAPIYAAREPKDESITSEKLAEEMQKHHKNVTALPDFGAIIAYLRMAQKGDIIFTIGAGDIFKVSEQLLHDL